jgi:hypothetical protein
MNFSQQALVVFLVSLFLSVPVSYASVSSAQIQVDIILAQDTPNGMDPRLSSLQSKLNQVFHFASYRLISREFLTLNFGKKSELSLPGSGSLSLQLMELSRTDVAVVQAEIQKGSFSILNTQFRLKRGGTVVLNGPSNAEGATVLGVSLV